MPDQHAVERSEQGGLVDGASMDHQIMGDLFCHVAAVGQVLTLDTALSCHLLEKADRINPNRVGKYGQLQEWVRDLDDTSNSGMCRIPGRCVGGTRSTGGEHRNC